MYIQRYFGEATSGSIHKTQYLLDPRPIEVDSDNEALVSCYVFICAQCTDHSSLTEDAKEQGYELTTAYFGYEGDEISEEEYYHLNDNEKHYQYLYVNYIITDKKGV